MVFYLDLKYLIRTSFFACLLSSSIGHNGGVQCTNNMIFVYENLFVNLFVNLSLNSEHDFVVVVYSATVCSLPDLHVCVLIPLRLANLYWTVCSSINFSVFYIYFFSELFKTFQNLSELFRTFFNKLQIIEKKLRTFCCCWN